MTETVLPAIPDVNEALEVDAYSFTHEQVVGAFMILGMTEPGVVVCESFKQGEDGRWTAKRAPVVGYDLKVSAAKLSGTETTLYLSIGRNPDDAGAGQQVFTAPADRYECWRQSGLDGNMALVMRYRETDNPLQVHLWRFTRRGKTAIVEGK